jgi:DNA-binding NarL/FixJ family response regulator
VLIVDDHPVVRDGLRASLSSIDGFRIVGEAGSGEQALDAVARTPVDVVLMDIQMPGMGGIEATRTLCARHPSVAVLILTMYGEDEFVLAALRAGARGYLLKGAQQVDVIRTITAVARGDAVIGHDVADLLLTALRVPAPAPSVFPQLTTREREILTLLADGLSNGPIGRRLGLSPRTVANHVSNILTKLGLSGRAEVAAWAVRHGVVLQSS